MTNFLNIDAGTIAYDVSGEGPLVVLAHGMGDSRQAYRFLTAPTRFTNHEEFSGVLVALIGPLLPTPKNDGYATFNSGLKQRVEGRTTR